MVKLEAKSKSEKEAIKMERASKYPAGGDCSEPIIFDTSDGQELRINMISPRLKKMFGCKIVKLSLDGGFTCPNRDGTKGLGGCIFCSGSGSGDMASSTDSIYEMHRAMADQIALLSDKWPKAKYIAYFQSYTNTYAPVPRLRQMFEAALSHPKVVGIAIATRSDCLPEDVVELLSQINEKTFMWVELGLQTMHDSTAKAMNLCHQQSDYLDALNRLTAKNIPVVAHLILGLPGESREMMLDSVKFACRKIDDSDRRIFGLKLHMLNVVKGSTMAEVYPDYVPFASPEEYIDLLIEAVELVPPEITLHRISGDAPRSTLIAPEWSYKKRTILNEIHKQMRLRNTWQGRLSID